MLASTATRWNRGVALYGDKVFVGTADAAVVALDAATGAIAGHHQYHHNGSWDWELTSQWQGSLISPDSSSVGGDHASSTCGDGDLHGVLRPAPFIVRGGDLCFRHSVPEVDQPQAALLHHVLPWIEYRHVVAPRLDFRDDIVNGGHEAVPGPDEGEGQDVQIGLELEPPGNRR